MSNKNTFWKYSFKSILNDNKPKDVVFAIVKEIKDEQGNPYKLIAWKIELKNNRIEHPFYGIIPYEDIKHYDLFPKGKGAIFPKFYINPNDSNFTKIEGDNIDLFKIT